MIRLGACVMLAALAATTAEARPLTEIHWVMGTYLRITVDGDAQALAALRACVADARRFDRTFSRYDASSELSRLHRLRTRAMSPAFCDLLDRSLALGRRTGGAFDVTIGALATLWRRSDAPSAQELRAARATLGGVEHLDDGVHLAPGTILDFDGIAKGYAVDACVGRLRAARVPRAFVSFGESSLYALGSAPGGGPWEVALRGLDPDVAVGTLHLRDQAVSVSASRRPDGRRVIVNPESGKLLDPARVAVIVAKSATDAEAYSKALLLSGPDGLTGLERAGAARAATVSAAGVRLGPAMRATGTFTVMPRARPLDRTEEGLS